MQEEPTVLTSSYTIQFLTRVNIHTILVVLGTVSNHNSDLALSIPIVSYK